MRRERTERVREVSAPRDLAAKPLKRLPQRSTTKQMHARLLRALGDRRVKRAFE
jgi:hypothetical protein